MAEKPLSAGRGEWTGERPDLYDYGVTLPHATALTIRAALASREAPPAAQEPAAWALFDVEGVVCSITTKLAGHDAANWTPLYTAPPPACQQEAVRVADASLTDLHYLANELSWDRRTRDISDRILAALRALKGGDNG